MSPSAERIKAWGKDTVDYLERAVAAANEQITAHNRTIPALARQLVQDRQDRLSDVGRLKGELGDGI